MRSIGPPHDSPVDGLTRRLRASPVPGPIAFVAVGALLAVVAPQLRPAVTPDLVLVALLPGLVFAAAYHLHWDDLRRAYGWIAFLAVPGVLVSAGIIALVLDRAIGLRLDLAFVVGAMVSATDPAAVVATFTKLHAPRRLVAIVDAESLLNDGTGLVAFAVALAFVTRGIAPGDAAWLFALTIAGSAVLGAAAGAVAALLVTRLPGRALPAVTSLVTAYGVYLVATAIGLSGVLATVLAGIALGSLGRGGRIDARAEAALDGLWHPLSALLNALIFIAVGIAIAHSDTLEALVPIAWGVVAVLVARAAVVYGLLGAGGRLLERLRIATALPVRWLHPLFWAGLRGAVATAAALSLPLDFPERALLQRITFGIVVVTLVVQGGSAGWLVRRAAPADQPARRLRTT